MLCLFGPTAVGKTAVMVRLFRGRAEAISADSMQVYRGLDIGTAKPDAAEREAVPHHLIDIKDPNEQYHAGEFVAAAERLIDEITARGRLPIVSGGTAFYFRNLLFGLPGTPQGSTELRAQLRRRLGAEGTGPLYDELKGVDPETAERISPNDGYRILRALEVWQMAGKPLSSFHVPEQPRGDYDIVLVGLWRERDELGRRIDRRVDGMMDAGLPQEVERLCRAGYGADAPAMRGIGYREFFRVAEDAACGFSSLPRDRLEAIAGEIKRSSRRYAKRQMTFFRKLPGVEWVHADSTERIATL
ncbi:MAG: tRNA (adenosine(37)-N6)-dimethylallyltransferase MiaA [Spirochaetaceae bacterium]